jgi:hypothetical protein
MVRRGVLKIKEILHTPTYLVRDKRLPVYKQLKRLLNNSLAFARLVKTTFQQNILLKLHIDGHICGQFLFPLITIPCST